MGGAPYGDSNFVGSNELWEVHLAAIVSDLHGVKRASPLGAPPTGVAPTG